MKRIGPFAGEIGVAIWLNEATEEDGSVRHFRSLTVNPRRHLEHQLDQPIPKWIRCNVTAVVRRDDDGIERNKVQTFDAVGIDQPEADAFAPQPPGEAADPKGEADTSFDPSKL